VTGSDNTGAAHAVLPPLPTSVGEARRLVRRSLRDAGQDHLIDDAELLVSEIVTNALVHAGTPIEVGVIPRAGRLRIEVADGSPHAPSPRHYTALSGTGRGLMLLEDLVDDWGVETTGPGKTVWFELGRHADSPDGPATRHTASVLDERGVTTVEVRLLDVPLLLHEAWHQHAEALLREYLLASLDLDFDLDDAPVRADAGTPRPVRSTLTDAGDPIQVHAEVSDALALLAEHIPKAGLASDDPGALMSDAVEPGITGATVIVPVPMASVRHFETLDRTLDAALEMAETGLTLTAPTQPEVRLLRRWLCAQVLAQSKGLEPVTWSPTDLPPPQPRAELVWDGSEVSDSPAAMIAMDDANRILALSPSALALLGYDDPGQIVGRRCVAIIPERYRQAHLAGFTLHFVNGRGPLLGNTVVVPALRRDGTEVRISLTVQSVPAPHGRTVFTAVLAPHG
jgi:PAS domain S-box-containing protein